MATRYWVGGNGTWNTGITTNWSATSGGAGGASAPTAADDVIFNAASSGASYVVTCGTTGNFPVCKSITTTAPAVGTLTFSKTVGEYFSVFNGDINIHAACIFSGTGTIAHAPTVAGTYTTTFNSPGGGVGPITYTFTQASASTTLNFCNSNTASFAGINISVGGSLVCTNAALTIASSNSQSFGTGATSVTMTGTTLNMNGSSSGTAIVSVGDSTTTTWAISTLAINMTNYGFFGNTSVQLRVGYLAATQPTAMGAVSFTSCGTSAWFSRASTLTLSGSAVTLQTGLTTTGAVALAASFLTASGAASFGSTLTGTTVTGGVSNVTFNGTTTVTGAVSFTGVAGLATQNRITVNGAATFSSTLAIVNSGTIDGTGSLVAGDTTISNLGSDTSVITVANLTTTSLTAPNTSINMSGALVVNGGVGKTFSFNYSIAEGTQLQCGSLTVSTPTCTIAGTATARIVFNRPISSTNPSLRPFTRTGTAPTLSYVTFLGTIINGGGSNYSGTKLGTDGLSSGFLPETPKSVYLIATGPQPTSFYSAIWTLVPYGGTGSTDNIPLPQDTILVNDGYSIASNFAFINGTYYLGSLITDGNPFGGTSVLFTSGTVYLFGDLRQEQYSGIASFQYLYIAKSGNTNRYLTLRGSLFQTIEIDVDVGSTTTLTVSGTNTPTVVSRFTNSAVQLRSGTISIASGVAIGSSTAQFRYFNVYNGAVVSGGGWAAHTNVPTYELGAIIPSSNYVMNVYYSGAVFSRYTNSATSTALNGALVVRGNGIAVYLGAGSTTSSNPMRYIEFNSGVSSGANVLSLEGDAYVQDLYSSNTNAVTTTLQSFGGPWTVYKTNGGTAYLQRYTATTTVFNVLASPANTFYTNGTLTGTTTGWNSGAPPASPSAGGFFMF